MERTPTEPRLQAAIDTLVGADVIELIAEARQEAGNRVRAELTDALTGVMLERAYREIAAGADDKASGEPDHALPEPDHALPEPDRAATSTPSPLGTGIYVYCVVPAGTEMPSALPSIDAAHSPTLIRDGRLAAVTSEVPLADFGEQHLRERLADLEWLERTARAHEQVLETIGRHATLIPMRLCAVYHSETGVMEMLAREAQALEKALAHLDGKTEWGVKVFANPKIGTSTSASASGSTGGGPQTNGTQYMQHRRSDRDQRRNADQQRHDACVAIHERLAAVVADALTSPLQRSEVSGHTGEMLLNGVYLVEDNQLHSFQTLVDKLQAQHEDDGLELLPTGPWPAYNFVPGTIGAAS